MSKKPGFIDLKHTFEAIADELVAAAKIGRVLHSSKNIRDAGDPVEKRFRDMIGDRLPAPFQISTGYLFDTKFNCTPQIDLIISDRTKTHAMVTAPSGSRYTPYSGVHALGEIKSHEVTMGPSMKQLGKIVDSYDQMDCHLHGVNNNIQESREAFTFILICDASDITQKKIENAYGNSKFFQPDIVLLLSESLIIVPGSHPLFQTDPSKVEINLSGHTRILAKPLDGEDYPKGILLLWLFYSIIEKLLPGPTNGERNPMGSFVSEVTRSYRLDVVKSL